MIETSPPADTEIKRRARQLALDAQRAALQCAEDAHVALDAGDYSKAATHCHRAHQHHLVGQAMRAVLL